MTTNYYFRNSEIPSYGFNRLSVANPFNYFQTNTYTYAPSKYSTVTYKTQRPQYYNQYIIEEKKNGLKTNPNPQPMTNAYNLNTTNIRSEQKYNPYYNPNNYPQRIDNVKDLMNYTYSERVPKYNTKTTNPTIANFTPLDGNSIKRITAQRTTTTYKSLPIASRIPRNNQNIYNTLINNNRNSVNYPYIVSNNQIKEIANNNNEQIIDINGPQDHYKKKTEQINNALLATNIQLTNKQTTDNNIRLFQQNINKVSEIISNSDSKEFHRKSTGGLVTSYGYFEDSNHVNRDHMEDQGKSIENLNGDPDKILFCLFDGHGGVEVSKFLQENFAIYMKKMLPFKNHFADIKKLFYLLDDKIKSFNKPKVGSTATIVYIERENGKKVLYCANVGDSRCVLVSRSGVMRLSYDDRLDDPNERARIMKQGGLILNDRVMGSLMLSRSFGDWGLKDFGVIVEPHITKIDIEDNDLFIIIASDGVWDVIKDQDCKQLTETNNNTLEICKNIIVDALSKNSQDNLSCFVISLK